MMIRTLAVAAAFCAAAPAFAQEVKIDFDKNANFASVKTFSAKIGTGWNNPISEKRILEEISQSIAAKGWTQVEESKADALVVLHGATEKQKSLNTFYSGGYGGYGWRGGWGGGMGTSHTSVEEYMVGTLVVDIFDAKSKQLMYRGIAQDELSDKADKNAKKLAKASDKLFKDFPPGSAKKK